MVVIAMELKLFDDAGSWRKAGGFGAKRRIEL